MDPVSQNEDDVSGFSYLGAVAFTGREVPTRGPSIPIKSATFQDVCCHSKNGIRTITVGTDSSASFLAETSGSSP